ncbi:hypothetical protein ABT337_01335 [Saccharopolyspora hirsuta]|uniref:Uncharacterized protein n=1 Tax=Saccharopolyspora hirsuta TaxID=1837 RepID=A0A5M7BPQ6_SACHI|nr:hypothetical protein [Saccharopolyspora hirsuta]KAA5831799.1 hypothetical protein F1721_18330 [Saccharopolyspora hirsuta]
MRGSRGGAEQTDGNLRDGEIVVTWTVADAELVRHRVDRERIFPAAPRVRKGRTAGSAEDIPGPRGRT